MSKRPLDTNSDSAAAQNIPRLLSAAMERKMADGATFASLTINSLCEDAGVSRSSFYVHFKDKSDLIVYLLQQVAAEMLEGAGPWFENTEAATRDDAARSVRNIVQTFERHRAVVRAAIEASGYDEKIGTIYKQIVSRLLRVHRHVLTRAHMAKKTRPDVSLEVADVLLWMVERCSYQMAATESAQQRQKHIAALEYVVLHSFFAD
jgi:TetR/AcrR family transcriptional regulator, ethionamide resistance regulator